MIHIPIIVVMKIASAIYNNRAQIAVGIQSLRSQAPTQEPGQILPGENGKADMAHGHEKVRSHKRAFGPSPTT